MDFKKYWQPARHLVSPRRIKAALGLLVTASLAIAAYQYYADLEHLATGRKAPEDIVMGSFPVVVPTLKYGFALDTLQVHEQVLRSGQGLGDILTEQGISQAAIHQLAANARPVFDIRKMQAGKPYTILSDIESGQASYLVYDPNPYEYYIFHLAGDLKAERVERPVVKQIETAAGIIESSLWKTMTANGLSHELTDKMEDALQWSIDFHHLQRGDEFKLIYEQHYIDGQPVSVGMVQAAYYKNQSGKEHHALFFEKDGQKGYYDEEGRPLRAGFLKSPVKYSRISSYFSMSRLHPILKYRRPHYGTDFAAPHGTPIMAVGDGVVSQASHGSGNGNFVKIDHRDNIQTQYLHMQGFAKGIRPGVRVQQGQVIGYVGATGLATGPHVCFRFWKNGQQVNHLKLELPNPEPLAGADMPAFSALRDQYLTALAGVSHQPQLAVTDCEEEQGNP